ncbi:malectin domain-containing carbohydrate-binding protein [Hymenobacter aerilatus]|uniref:Malectin domain-containing carbohydrate-binding protein n=1 Tax=Hymenobacter aerilatus TaxID=2932251 RepID=A0A8T9SS46_9BACT|nr:malectin domain-containing carbohydrate-binding protein [Hymenobacter aerilatus]UOR03573.1 malectin domain-containing carbohydrate-binding protein [Hymenobacter aerilatus]
MRYLILVLLFTLSAAHAQTSRTIVPLLDHWRTVADDVNQQAYNGFEKTEYQDKAWQTVAVPHNWDAYAGYRRLRHGNRHGYAWYRKTFTTPKVEKDARYFLFFEGVGSYATVWLNGKQVGYHAGGRTTFTLDVTDVLSPSGRPNVLAVRADHPANIQDLPWVCGGCSEERGFSEGSQPMGIFRPVSLVITNPVRVEPFGVHIWADSTLTAQAARLHVETEVKNYGRKAQTLTVVNQLLDKQGRVVAETKSKHKLAAGQMQPLRQQLPTLQQPHLWSLEDPYLYQLVTRVSAGRKLLDEQTTSYGIRWVSWPIGAAAAAGQKQFLLNGKPVLINGIAEYEHLLGQSHAFTPEQIQARVGMVKAAGFNAFRDAHQPHNLRYQANWDSLGVLWWPQMAAHVWYDTPEFRQNFKTLLVDWIKERRNSPSVVLWGLENESTLPEDFARECTALIRQLDPTASRERKVTTCNGGKGTDWDVPQNWTGTYGGDPTQYGADLQRQVLVGEYGAWRTLDLHQEGPPAFNSGPFSEDRFTQLMELKVRLAEEAKANTAGHFFWLLTSHDNPGRVQGGEGWRELDRIGPVNYKGLLTPWEEPTDAFYMFRSHYAPKETEPMVYLASHTWPDRWLTPGRQDSLIVYSNCDEVELFNDANAASLGRKTRAGVGTHFQWDGVDIKYNVLYAIGYVNGKAVAKDYIVLHHLPKAPGFDKLLTNVQPITAPQPGLNYLYRVNCGGPAYTDSQGQTWQADQPRTTPNTWGSESWTREFPGLNPFFASQRRTFDPIQGTADQALFQSFRYGRDALRYTFPVPNGEYQVELYFTEPWLGTGGGLDCTGWRLFDVAINQDTVIHDLDIWKEVGHDHALKKTVKARVTDGQLVISFPRVASGQALLSAVAIATTNASAKPAPAPKPVISSVSGLSNWSAETWLDTGNQPYTNGSATFSSLPSVLYGAEWLRQPMSVVPAKSITTKKSQAKTPSAPSPKMDRVPEGEATRQNLSLSVEADVYLAFDARQPTRPTWLQGYEDTKTTLELADATGAHPFRVYRKRFAAGATVTLGPDAATPNTLPYLVVVQRASTIEPAYDLKPVTGYKPATARTSGPGMVRETVHGKESITFKEPRGGALEWTFQVGVADTYSLTVRYANQLSKPLTAKLTVTLADGTVIKEEAVELVPSKPGKWNYLASSTGSMINAGSYLIKLTATDATGLSVSGLEVQ